VTKFLRKQAVSGVKWNGLAIGIITSLQFVKVPILAHLLSPSDFGLMGMIMVFIGFAQSFADMGVSNAIIFRQDTTKDQLSSLYWLNIFAAVFVFCIVCMCAPLIVKFYHEPRLSHLLYLTALIFLISPLGQQFQILLQKELKFDVLAKIQITATIVNMTVTIGLAFAGLGVYSLIWGQLAASSVKVALLCGSGWQEWKPSLHFAKDDLRGYMSFGFYQMGERAINYLSANMDYLLIGRFLGPAALGFYTLAYEMVIFPLSKINPVITRVMFPIFSKIQGDNNAFRVGYGKVMNYITLVSFPMMAGMFFVAPEFITLFFGEKWEPSIMVLQILCMVGAFKSLGNPIGVVLLAKGRADIGFFWNILAMILVIFTVMIGANWGINGVAFGILALQLPFFLIIQPIVNRLIEMKFIQYLKSVRTPFVCSAVMIIGIIFLKLCMKNLSAPIVFTSTIISGAIVYISAFFLIDKNTFREIVAMVGGK
jgi:O-antigen/teichoic acid export membrane protein